ncbi:MAG: DUF5615 family PIN-like protein [Anaerolineae bacterium]|nr:DUF5615 family PIN-like protein [Anaerolineae bacterium]MCB9129511.1 DUF5615 family PIN-like protein [Anaerolineales bacterium]MCB0227833.1 DUF5615 family PIN-like protein [Anaerolineae bacterium]MCB0236559.1 DUF5615 family PIN-like protein [Anaerolineae bacterium]MCB0239831.1 DUF5615 family PIN-like protein [Anaerolineae bacterium]
MTSKLTQGLRRRGVDVTTTVDAGLCTLGDESQLAYVRRTGRILVTSDAGFVARHIAGEEHPGIVFYQPQSRSIDQVIAFLAFLAEVMNATEMTNRLEYA